MVNIKVKKLVDNATLPVKAHGTDAGYDLTAASVESDFLHNQIKVHTGIAIQPEPGYYCEIFPRSSVYKKQLELANSVAIIDSGYTGEIILVFDNIGNTILHSKIEKGERIAQLIVRKQEDAVFEEVTVLDTTSRGEGGFGSTGV